MKVDLDNISQFIFRYLQGKLTEEERTALEEWLQEKKERQEWIAQLRDPGKRKEEVQLYGSFDIHTSWEKVKKACWGRFLGKRFRYLKIAVVVFLGLGGTIFYLSQEIPVAREKQLLSLAEVRPGGNQAVLILENGEEVNLQRNKGDHLSGKGWKIENDGKLCYENPVIPEAVEDIWHTLRVPKGGEYTLLLEDGTQVRLNSDSELKYPVHFGQGQRRVFLSGEAYFKVARDEAKQFVVETDRMDVQVFGTSFDVMAYPEEATFYATLVEGNVEVSGEKMNRPGIRLQPGWQAACEKGEITTREVDVDLYTAWIQGRFAFKSEELEIVLRKLERWYNVQFMVTDETIRKKRFTGSVSRYGDIGKILNMLEWTTNIRFEVVGNQINVVKN